MRQLRGNNPGLAHLLLWYLQLATVWFHSAGDNSRISICSALLKLEFPDHGLHQVQQQRLQGGRDSDQMGQEKVCREHSQVLVKGRCVPTLPTLDQVLIYTYTVYKHHNHMWNTAFITQQHFNSTSCPQQQIINSPQKRGVWAQQLVHYTEVNNTQLLNIATPAFPLHFAA